LAGRPVVEYAKPGCAMQGYVGNMRVNSVCCTRIFHHAGCKAFRVQAGDLRKHSAEIIVAGDPREFQHEPYTGIPAERHGFSYLLPDGPELIFHHFLAGVTRQDKCGLKTDAGAAFLHGHGNNVWCIGIDRDGGRGCCARVFPWSGCGRMMGVECGQPLT